MDWTKIPSTKKRWTKTGRTICVICYEENGAEIERNVFNTGTPFLIQAAGQWPNCSNGETISIGA